MIFESYAELLLHFPLWKHFKFGKIYFIGTCQNSKTRISGTWPITICMCDTTPSVKCCIWKMIFHSSHLIKSHNSNTNGTFLHQSRIQMPCQLFHYWMMDNVVIANTENNEFDNLINDRISTHLRTLFWNSTFCDRIMG